MASGYFAYLLEAKPEEKPAAPTKTRIESVERSARSYAVADCSRSVPHRLAERKRNTALSSCSVTPRQQTNESLATCSTSPSVETQRHSCSQPQREKKTTNGVYAVTTDSDSEPVTLLSGKGKYQRLTWDEENTQLAFTSDKEDADAKQPKFRVYHWNRKDPQATEVVAISSPGFRKEFVVSERANLSFSLDGSHLFLGTAPPPEPEKNPDEEIPADEKVLVDLWHWKDDYVQPIQRIRAEQDRNRSYRAVYDLQTKKFVQLADESMENISPSNDGSYAIGTDNRKYRTISDYDPGFTDYYLVNTDDGSRKPILTKQRGNVSLSPNAKYAIYFDGKDWNSYSVADGSTANLTKSISVNFYNEENDTPSTPGSYGIAGWTKDDKDVLIYDRYDIWQVSPDGSSAKNLTDGVGRKESTTLRYVRLDPRERWIDPDKPMLLSAENQETRDSGFYRDKVNSTALPQKLLMAAKDFNNPAKAKDADVLVMTASRFDQFPDVWVTNSTFRELKRVSNGDAQRAAYNWGTGELVSFKNTDGVPSQGSASQTG